MRFRRMICFVLGLWLGGGLLMVWLASSGFRQVDRLLARPSPSVAIQIRTLGYRQARDLLRYQVAEQNRSYFETWEMAQLVGGTVFFFYLLFGTAERKFGLSVVLAMVLIVAAQRFLLTPQLVAMERNLELLPPEASGSPRNAFWVMHSAYFGLEVFKWGMALVLTGKMIFGRRRGRSNDAGDDFDVVDKADYGHVNG
jgi:hypothetical protein